MVMKEIELLEPPSRSATKTGFPVLQASETIDTESGGHYHCIRQSKQAQIDYPLDHPKSNWMIRIAPYADEIRFDYLYAWMS